MADERPMSFDLDTFELSTRDSLHSLSVSSTASLLVPASFRENASIEDLAHLVKTGAIWVGREGSCRFEIRAVVSGRPLKPSSTGAVSITHLQEGVQECLIWTEMGLELKRDLRPRPASQSPEPQLCFSVDHPASADGLIAPPKIPCAKFRAVSCHFRFRGTKLRSKQQALRPPAKLDPANGAGYNAEGLSVADIRWKVAMLLKASLYIIFGIARRTAGVRTLDKFEGPSLLDIAPAVWNSHYFKSVASRAMFIPSIASSLAYFENAQTPLLRQKIQKLLGPSDQQDAPKDHSEALYDVTEQNLWKVLLTNISFTKRPERRRIPNAAGSGMDESLQDGIFVQGTTERDSGLSELPGIGELVDTSQDAARGDAVSILRRSPPLDLVDCQYPLNAESDDSRMAFTNATFPDDIYVDESQHTDQTWRLPRAQRSPDLPPQSPLPPRMSPPYNGTDTLPGIYIDLQYGADELDSHQDIPELETDDGIFILSSESTKAMPFPAEELYFLGETSNGAGGLDADLVEQVDNHGARTSPYQSETKSDDWPRNRYWENGEAQRRSEPRQLTTMPLPGLLDTDSCGF